MDSKTFQHLYDYHFTQNRQLWDEYVSRLSDEQFNAQSSYSKGSVREQLLHLMDADDAWFSGLRDDAGPTTEFAGQFHERGEIRRQWDQVESRMREFLAGLADDQLATRPFPDHEEDSSLLLWQVLLHVVNHGTDHRAQLLRQLNDFGISTTSQDYVFYCYDHPLG